MHILAILIAAVLSTQFVSPNGPVGTITTNLSTTTAFNMKLGLPAFFVNLAARADEVVSFDLVELNDGNEQIEVPLTIASTVASGTKIFEFDAGVKHTGLAGESGFFVRVTDAEGPIITYSEKITFTGPQPWTIEPTRGDKTVYQFDLAESPEFELKVAATEHWHEGMKAKLATSVLPAGITVDVVRTVSTEGAVKYTIAAGEALSTLVTPPVTTPVPVTVTLLLDGATTEHTTKPTFNIVKNLVITINEPTKLTPSHTTIALLKVTPDDTTGWAGKTVDFRITKAGVVTPVTGTLTDGTTFWSKATVALTGLTPLVAGETLLVEFQPAEGAWLAATATITVVGPVFTVFPKAIHFPDVANFKKIQVKFDDATVSGAIKGVLTEILDLPSGAISDPNIELSGTAAAGIVEFDFTSKASVLDLATNDKVYIYATKGTVAEALALSPVQLDVKTVTQALEVEPAKITSAHTKIATLKVTPAITTGWTDEVAFKLVKAGVNDPITGTLTKDSKLPFWTAEDVDLTPFLPFTAAGNLVLSVSIDGTQFLSQTANIAIDIAAFTVDPNPILVSQVATLDGIDIEFTDAQFAGSINVVLSKTLDLAAIDPSKEVTKTGTVTAGQPVKISLIAGDITKIGPLTANAVFFVYAFGGTAQEAITKAPVRVTVKADPIPTLIYKITPDTATLAEIDALTSITIEPLQGQSLPSPIGVEISLKPTTANTDPAPLWKAGVTKHETDDKWAVSFTNAELKGIGTIVAGSKILVKVSKTNLQTELLPKWAELEVTANPSTDPKFTIDPIFVTEGALAKADSPKFTIGIVNGVDKPDKETTAKVIFKAGTKTLPVEFAPTGETPNVKWEIAAGECDFSLLEITTFPVTGSVEFFPKSDGEAFGPTIPFTFKAKEDPEAAMGVSPLLSLLAALVFLFVKLF